MDNLLTIILVIAGLAYPVGYLVSLGWHTAKYRELNKLIPSSAKFSSRV